MCSNKEEIVYLLALEKECLAGKVDEKFYNRKVVEFNRKTGDECHACSPNLIYEKESTKKPYFYSDYNCCFLGETKEGTV